MTGDQAAVSFCIPYPSSPIRPSISHSPKPKRTTEHHKRTGTRERSRQNWNIDCRLARVYTGKRGESHIRVVRRRDTLAGLAINMPDAAIGSAEGSILGLYVLEKEHRDE